MTRGGSVQETCPEPLRIVMECMGLDDVCSSGPLKHDILTREGMSSSWIDESIHEARLNHDTWTVSTTDVASFNLDQAAGRPEVAPHLLLVQRQMGMENAISSNIVVDKRGSS